MSQKIEEINVKDLVLWTENPRDPIDPNTSDQEIADRSISKDRKSCWSLNRLFKEMGTRFDQSEIPTVAYNEGKPVVYDGNRRVLIGKIIHNLVDTRSSFNFSGFDFPESIPCNVCDVETALQHVDRKHADRGTWKPLERDMFKHRYMGEPKSPFLVIEEATQLVSRNPELNQRFVKDEIFDLTTLHKMGFSTNNSKFKSKYANSDDAQAVLENVVDLVKRKDVSTRKYRGRICDLLDKRLLSRQTNTFTEFVADDQQSGQRKFRIFKSRQLPLFGKKLRLKPGSVNNLYSDLIRLYTQKNRKEYSEDFPRIIRMALRLITEVASGEQSMGDYIKANWKEARKKLSKDEKTTVRAKSIKDPKKTLEILQDEDPGCSVENDLEATIAVSLVVGRILENTHGQ